MKLDIERVKAIAEALPKSRLEGTRGAKQAADEIAGIFTAAGLHVERIDAPRLVFPAWFWATLFSFNLGLLVFFTESYLPRLHRAWFTALSLPPLFLGAWWAGRRAGLAGRTERSQHVIGKPVVKDGGTVRVVLLTCITTPAAAWQGVCSLSVLSIQAVSFISLMLLYERHAFHNPDITLAFLLWFWLSSMFLVLVPNWYPAHPKRGDNRTGLALLAELARNWPASLAGKVETISVASQNLLALRTDLHLRSQIEPPRPTMFITLDAPGVGPELVIAGRGIGQQLATASARDLWIPHRSSSSTIGLIGASCVAIRGKHDDSPIDPALLSAAAQLVLEVTLRWMKQSVPAEPKGQLDLDSLD